jgi:integrase
VHFLSASDVVPFLNEVDHICSNIQVRLAIRLMLFMGLRTSEVASLRWDWFRSDFSEVLLGHSMSGVELPLPLPTLLRERLISLRDHEILLRKSTDCEVPLWVFSDPNGNPRFPMAARSTIQRAAIAIGLDGTWSPHDLRISCMFILNELGVDPLVIMGLLRYRNPRFVWFRRLSLRDTLLYAKPRLEQITSDHPGWRLQG